MTTTASVDASHCDRNPSERRSPGALGLLRLRTSFQNLAVAYDLVVTEADDDSLELK